MKTRDLIDLILLAAIWGGSYLFMRVSVPEFGAVPMMMVRVSLAGLFLLPVLFWKKRQQIILENIAPISFVGIFSSALPFSLIAYSTLYVTAGFASVLNAATPIFAAIIAFVWLGQKLNRIAVLGLIIGILGVLLLVWNKIGFSDDIALAILAGIIATICYGIAANFTKKNLKGIDPVAITAGSLIVGGIVLLPLGILWWPETAPSIKGWINLIILAIVCTAFAQVIFFRLIERTNATNATTVTFLIPIFGLLWGNLFLDEVLQVSVLVAGSVILLGTGMTTGLIKFNR